MVNLVADEDNHGPFGITIYLSSSRAITSCWIWLVPS